MASAGKFSVLLNVNHKGQTKKKKKKHVGVDARTPISAVTQKTPKPEQIPPATRNATAKKLTATPAKKIRPKISKTSPNSGKVDENGATASSSNFGSNEHSLLDESEQWEEWKKKDEELVAKMFQSDIERAIALSRNDSQNQIDMQLAAWLAATKHHKLSQDKMEKDTVHLKNGIQKNLLVQNGPTSSAPVRAAKQGPSKIVQQVHVEQKKKVTENSKPKNKVQSVKVKQTEACKHEIHNTKSEDSEPQLTKAQKKRLKKKELKVAEVGLKENETNSVIAAAELPPVISTKNLTQKTSNTEVRVSVPKDNDDKNGLKRNELAAEPFVEDVISETGEKTILDSVPSADADLLEIAVKQPQSHDNVLALQRKLEEKDLEIAEYRQREMKFALDIAKKERANRKLCRLFAKGDMKQKVELLMQIDELTDINDYLTKKIQDLHVLLEQEKSKSEIMQQELAKHQVGM